MRFAAHLLEGPAASWWDTFQITHPLDTVTWAMFEDGFKTNHVSSGVLSLKRKEFHNLRQTNRIVAEYIEEFNNLSCYAPEDVDTDSKRRERFLDGLSDELSVQLLVVYCPTFQELMDKARILEGKHKQVERRKRKHNGNHNSGSYHKRTFHDGNDNSDDHDNGANGHNGNGHNKGSNGHQHNGNKDLSNVECYKCRKLGHYAYSCPEDGTKSNSSEKATVNHMNMKRGLNKTCSVTGKLLLNLCNALIPLQY